MSKPTKPLNLTRHRVRVLSLLRAKNRGPSIREMAMALGGVTPNAIHEVLRMARDAGIAETDGKAGGWHLTAHGESVVALLSSALAAADSLGDKR
jgi:DNA-binding transcriptional regulator YhcF (GntR family)